MKTFTDDRGSIHDFGDGINIITCKTGSKRANHYHKTSAHKSILTRGSLDYYERKSNSNEPIIKRVISAPAIFDTTFLVDHLMHFKEDSEFVCIRIGGSETPEEYEKDLVRLDYDMEKAYHEQFIDNNELTEKDIKKLNNSAGVIFGNIKNYERI